MFNYKELQATILLGEGMQIYAPSFPEGSLLQPFRRARKGGSRSFGPVHKEGVLRLQTAFDLQRERRIATYIRHTARFILNQ